MRATLLPALLFLAALPLSLAWSPPAPAQTPRPVAALSLAQAERNSVHLKQGMSAEEVEKLLGTPRRTALKAAGGSSGTAPWQGTLQWTYFWPGSSSQGSLNVVFAAATPQQWLVNSWEWSSY